MIPLILLLDSHVSLILFQSVHTSWNNFSRSVSITVSFPKLKNICKACIQSDHLIKPLKEIKILISVEKSILYAKIT